MSIFDPDTANNAAGVAATVSKAPLSITGVSAAPTVLLPPLSQMVPVTIGYTATDSRGQVTTSLTVTSDEPVRAPLRDQGSPGRPRLIGRSSVRPTDC